MSDLPLERLSAAAWARLERLAAASPLYARFLRQHPAFVLWLEDPHNLESDFRYQALLDEWKALSSAHLSALTDDEAYLDLLRRWRRLMSLRIAYRGVNRLADEPTCTGELTRLAEFCVRECYLIALKRWTARYGEPWDETRNRPARFAVIALGKLGGEELNFSSDIDLLFLYEGDGACRRDDQPAAFTAAEFFARLAETLTRQLSTTTAEGFLFRVDARLRPEGSHGPLVRSLASLEYYYASQGQTWERLALLKARTVAGDFALGGELLESLQSFRYPRHPPSSLLAEIAAMKARTEREIVGVEDSGSDLKRGAGGIREIEFIVQSFQLLHAGRYPFLQTHQTAIALEQLERYELLAPADAAFLREAYWFLRQVEHRCQMREEQQTHALPSEPAALEAIARSLQHAGTPEFLQHLAATRRRVRALYETLFAPTLADAELEAWWQFFTTKQIPPHVAARLTAWFGETVPAAEAVSRFTCGDRRQLVTRELVTRFRELSRTFDALMPTLARPLTVLARLTRFAESYGTRQQFFNSCAMNPQLLRVLALLFDRSTYTHELLCTHPEILEEVLRPEILRQHKDPAAFRADLSNGPAGDAFDTWLPLYVRAEQVRYAIGELLGFFTLPEVEAALTQLADAVVAHTLVRSGVADRLLVVALGKYGGAELTFGSDLDVLFIADDHDFAIADTAARELRRLLGRHGPLGPVFAIDVRLRPHGDAGPLVTTIDALSAYHASGSGQLWERQLLTRARTVAGPSPLAGAFLELATRLLYAGTLTTAEAAAIWAMRSRIERERDVVSPPERAFKTAPGGLIDFEFSAQILQLRHGQAYPGLRQTGTRSVFQELARLGLVAPPDAAILLENYDFLRRIEIRLRCDENQAVSVIPPAGSGQLLLARWLGFAEEAPFWAEYTARLAKTRNLVLTMLSLSESTLAS
ncbi:MAG TPA: bifunctional [glutamate--ammonia ligase]-adenylyl-L-tyrosine phosphorylase/[glutamate--ammonia-ligase] adenylyltransferase [Opitutaceae bacterium]